jgi:membrane protease YdiL (CAAX protease family)
MIEPLSHAATCRSCGATLSQSAPSQLRFCPFCGAAQATEEPPVELQTYPPPADQYPFQPVAPAQPTLDADHPRWGIWTALGVWAFSVAALLGAQVVVLIVLLVIERPAASQMQEWAMQPHVVAWSVYSTIFAHLVTIALCWGVVTRMRQQPFLESLGWNWAGHSPWYWLLVALGLYGVIIAANILFSHILPEKKPPFAELLEKGLQVRIAIALLASFSAPLVEEIIYRGVLFSGLRKRFSAVTTVALVTLLFAGVHVPQYWRAWASIAGLLTLSLMLTIVRAYSKSLLPCIVIHFLNNVIASVAILFGKGDM